MRPLLFLLSSFLLLLLQPSSSNSTPSTSLLYPDIFIVGVQKAATTSLNGYLVTHPKVCDGGDKEKHFFDSDEFLSREGLQHYYKEYRHCSKKELTLDASPRYIQVPIAVTRILQSYKARDLVKKRFILLLRAPAARLFSEYQDYVRKCVERGNFSQGSNPYPVKQTHSVFHEARAAVHCNETMHNYTPGMPFDATTFYSFDKWIDSPSGAYELTRGYYYDLLLHFLQAGVPRRQLLVLSFQDLVGSRTSDTLHRVLSFLGLEARNVGGPSAASTSTSASATPEHEESRLPSRVQQHTNITLFDCPTATRLEAHYNASNARLQELIESAAYGERPPEEPPFPPFDSAFLSCRPHPQGPPVSRGARRL